MPALTPQQVATMLDKVRVIARKYVSRMLSSDGQIDFASEVAFLYPLEVIMTIVGVPEQDHAKMLTWTQWLFDSADPDLRRPGPYPQSAGQAVAELDEVVKLFSDYYLALAADRRAHPRNDLATTLSLATLDGQLMGDYELASYFIITATAGHDTTAASIATGMAQLAATPALLGALKNTPDLLPGFVDESVRWATPVKHFIRSATQDTMLGDTSIRKGDLLFLAYPSANRDEAVFADPFKFDVTRKPNRHVGFGYGAHVCIGQHLAKAEMRIFWEELLPHLDEISLRAPVQMIASNFVSGPKAVPIRFKQV
jgi:cytochrome P450